MDTAPSTNGDNGRAPRGRFAKGNPGGPGNPHARKVQQLRSALLKTVTAADVRAIVKSLVSAAIKGDVAAAKVILDRVLGPPIPLDFDDRLARLESLLGDDANELRQ